MSPAPRDVHAPMRIICSQVRKGPQVSRDRCQRRQKRREDFGRGGRDIAVGGVRPVGRSAVDGRNHDRDAVDRRWRTRRAPSAFGWWLRRHDDGHGSYGLKPHLRRSFDWTAQTASTDRADDGDGRRHGFYW